MASSDPSPQPSGRDRFDLTAWRPSKRALLWTLAAFAVGLLLFLLVWLKGRDNDFYRAGDEAPPTAAAPQYRPLPAPKPADEDGASGIGESRDVAVDDDGDRPRLVETTPPPTPSMPQAAPPAPAADIPVAPMASMSQPQPIAGQTPSPDYPAASLRRGESGTVLVRATVGIDGRPDDVEVANSSGSRRLDRAAVRAVRRWRFHPAQSNGQPVEANVNVPIDFKN